MDNELRDVLIDGSDSAREHFDENDVVHTLICIVSESKAHANALMTAAHRVRHRFPMDDETNHKLDDVPEEINDLVQFYRLCYSLFERAHGHFGLSLTDMTELMMAEVNEFYEDEE